MKPEETFDYPLRWSWHKIQKHYNAIAMRHDLTMTMGYVLLNIDQDKGTPSTQLGPKIGMEASSLTRTLKTMENKGYISKQSDDADRRKVNVCLTPLGRIKREASKEAVLHFNQYLTKKISATQKKQFFEAMEIINDVLSNENIFEELPEYDEAKN